MALSLGGDRRRWSCRAARRGKGRAGCRHFHVHYHIPRQVWAFSPLRLPSSFSLLSYLLVLPVLFFAMLSFLVCFGWFTLVYFMSSLWSRSKNRARDSGEPRREDEREERAVNLVTEDSGVSCKSEVCAQGQETKDVFEDEFSDETRHMSTMASTGICVNDHECADDEKILTEVMTVERNSKPLKPFAELYGSSEKHQQVMAIPIDCFLETRSTKGSTSLNTAKLLDGEHGEQLVSYREEMVVLSSPEILEFIDKHDSAEIVVNGGGNDLVISEVSCSDDSAHHGLEHEHMKEDRIRQEQSTPEFSVSSVAKWLPEDAVDEWQETQNLVIEHNSNLPEAASNDEYRKQIVALADEAHDSAKLLDMPYGEEFVAYRKETMVLSSPENLEFIDKHETAEIVVNGSGNDFVIPEVWSSDDSAHHGLENQHMKEIKQEQSTPEFSVSGLEKWLPEDVVDESQETQNLVIEHDSNLPEATSSDENRKRIVGLSDEAHNSVCEVVGFPLDSVCKNISESVTVTNTLFKQQKSYQDSGLQEDLIQNKKVESSTSPSAVCDFANNHWRILETLDGFANEENIRKDSSPDTSVREMVEDEGIDDTYASMGAPHRLPVVQRSPAPWWNLCGVLDVFAEGEEN